MTLTAIGRHRRSEQLVRGVRFGAPALSGALFGIRDCVFAFKFQSSGGICDKRNRAAWCGDLAPFLRSQATASSFGNCGVGLFRRGSGAIEPRRDFLVFACRARRGIYFRRRSLPRAMAVLRHEQRVQPIHRCCCGGRRLDQASLQMDALSISMSPRNGRRTRSMLDGWAVFRLHVPRG